MIFGKAKGNTFNMDLSSPLSPLIAFGVALSTFDEKYFCEWFWSKLLEINNLFIHFILSTNLFISDKLMLLKLILWKYYAQFL